MLIQTHQETSPLNETFLSFDILSFLEDHKIFDIVTINLEGKSTIAEIIIVASGRSQKHIRMTAELLREHFKLKGMKFISIEGLPDSDWILIDIGEVIVHLFKPEVRTLYNLEKMWDCEH